MDDARTYTTVTEITATTGEKLRCDSYLSHPAFCHTETLCRQLHFAFVKYASNRSKSKGREFRQAIELFLEFRLAYHALNPPSLALHSLTDLTVSVLRQFERFIQKEHKEGRLKRRPVDVIGSFRHALNFVADNDDAIPKLLFPALKYIRDNVSEPLDDSTLAELEAALSQHVEKLYAILENRAKAHQSKPYTFEELSSLVNPKVDCCNVVRWWQHAVLTHATRPNVSKLNYYLERAQDPLLEQFLRIPGAGGCRLKEWEAYFDGEGAKYKLEKPENPFGTYIQYLVLDHHRSLATMLSHGYPFGLDLDEIFEKYSSRCESNLYHSEGDVLQALVSFYSVAHIAKNEGGRPSTSELLNLYYPSDADMACLILFLMLQTGWNKETVLAIDPTNFEDALSGILSESQTTIFSEKNRSQGSNLPYYSPKTFKAITDKANRYSAYNLIILAKALSEPLASQPYDKLRERDKESDLSPLFLYLRNNGLWRQVGRTYSLSAESVFRYGVREFLSLYPIHEQGKRLTTAKDLTGRLRPTWVQKQLKSKPLSLIALIQGHDSSETTDLYYDSSGAAMKERRQRLRSEQEEIVSLLKQRKFSGLLGSNVTNGAHNSEITIFHFPGHENGLWGCSNRYRPDWPGFEQRVKAAEKCTPSPNCLFCSRCCIFEDSLPYLIDRHAQIEALMAEREESDFSSHLKAEHELIDWLIMAWDDDRVIQRAFAYQQRHTPLFPSDPSLFTILFDDS